MQFDSVPASHYFLAKSFLSVVAPFVQVFFILSGFGLTLAYLNQKANWSWRKWAWRRVTKIVVPYELAVIFSFIVGILGSYLFTSVNLQFSWTSLLAYMTFLRNFFPSSWPWNTPLWFMPVIIGLYISFPVLIKILEKWGPWLLLLISIFVTYGAIAIWDFLGISGGHQADLFLFWVIQFSLGMVLAYIKESDPQKLRHLTGLKAFLIGIGLFAFSWGIRTYIPSGKLYNDMFTSVGIFLILLNLVWICKLWLPITGKALQALSSKSYLMYLIHWPIMAFLIGPLLDFPVNALVQLLLGGVYIISIYGLCHLISQPLNKFTTWLYQLSNRVGTGSASLALPRHQ
jgi:peptidoglycan/LPS O-acetylase OafA/YrhL